MPITRSGNKRTTSSKQGRSSRTTPVKRPPIKKASVKKASVKKLPPTKKPKTQGGCDPSCDCEAPPASKPLNAKLLAVTRPPVSATGQQQSGTEKMVFVTKPTGLGKIMDDAVQLAVWQRASAPNFVTALADPSIRPSALPEFEGVVTPKDAAQTMKKHLLSQKKRALTDGEVDELVGDISQLVSIFAKLVQSKTVSVRLEVLADDGCQFWHQDCVPFRLVTTYRGPCTEWVHPDFSNVTLRRRQFGSKHAQSLSHHDVALFKGRGETFLGDALLNHPGIVHRSPRIEGSGVYRVVLVLDMPFDTWLSDPQGMEDDISDDGSSSSTENKKSTKKPPLRNKQGKKRKRADS